MWGYILIRKISEVNGVYYYKVYKDHSEDVINYYIGLDSHLKKIYFFEDTSLSNIFAIYDYKMDKFERYDQNFEKIINGRVIMKALSAINNNDFPDSISWES